MPRKTREYLLRYADQASNDLDRAGEKLIQIADTYGETRPEHRDAVLIMAAHLAELQKLLYLFRHEVM